MDILEIRKEIKKMRWRKEDREKIVAKFCLQNILKICGENFMKIREDIVFSMIALDPGNPLLFNFMKKILEAKNEEKVKEIAERAIKYIEEVPKLIARHWKRIIKDKSTIFVHSYSTNVREILKEAGKNLEIEVVISEGSPAKRGRELAKDICNYADVTLIPDTAINYFMPEIDLVLLGGLAITKFGLVGRVGNSIAALSAKFHKVPVYAAIETMKVSERIIIKELPMKVPKGVKGRCPGYDLTRNGLIKGYICEEGIIKAERFYPFAVSKLKGW